MPRKHPDLTDLLRAQDKRDQQRTRSQLPPWLRGEITERTRDPQPTYADPTARKAVNNSEPRTQRR